MNALTKLPIICLVMVLAGCGKSGSLPPRENIDACKLLTSQEIEAVQGSPVKDTKGSEQGSGRGVRNAQCYFGVEQSNRSVSLTVTQADTAGSNRNSAKASWEETFGRFEKEDRDKETEAEREKKESLREQKKKGEEEEESVPPRKIAGVGDEAFWSGSRVGGALYVLKKDVYIRISLGGPDPEETRIEKSKTLAQKAIDRL